MLNSYNVSISNYLWQDNSTQPGLQITKAGEYFVRVKSYNGCINSDTINITVSHLPSFSLGADTVLCDGTMLNYNLNIAGASYLWNDGNTNNQYAINKAGNYWLKISESGCSSSDTISVSYKPSPIVNLGNDTTLCEGTNYTLNAFNTGAVYVWQDNSTQPAYTVFKPGTYKVQVELSGCVSIDTINVYYKTTPVFSLGDDSLICPGVPLTLSAATPGALSYKWQDGSMADHYIASTAGLYSVQVANECGTATKAINITNALCQLEMPDAFTPNNDGMNDKFGVKYPQFIKAFHMVIYNRWGAKIFETKNPLMKWDGTVKSIPQNIGSYVWIINFTDNDNKQQTAHGMVTLLR
jgi:gliding motility-associated-like protein